MKLGKSISIPFLEMYLIVNLMYILIEVYMGLLSKLDIPLTLEPKKKDGYRFTILKEDRMNGGQHCTLCAQLVM